MDKKDFLALLASLTENPDLLTRKHLKKIYALLIASGQYPRCPWCNEPIYNINDFTWDHITPKSEGGDDDISNLQPMHKSCNNEKKENTIYTASYQYDICSELEHTILSVRVAAVCKKAPKKHQKKQPYNNNKRRTGKHR